MTQKPEDHPTGAHGAGAGSRDGSGDRDLWPALRRGWRLRCPNCGSGPLMKGYLSVRESCPVCRQELHHHRADDGPAYLTILVVGHLSAPLLGLVWMTWQPDPMMLFTGFAIFAVALSLYMLPRVKGGLIAFQWARRLHGFAAAPEPDTDRPGPEGPDPA